MADRSLHDPITLGALRLRNRYVMAPMTRSRALPDASMPESAPTYYSQRASAGLIVSEGVCISPVAIGNPRVPGLWTDEQTESWARIADAVHAAGGTMVAQLWHTGRASHPTLQPGEQLPVGPSALAIDGVTYARDGRVPYVAPRPLETLEIPVITAQYARAAANARRAGLDGVEMHAANGYLIDQFLQDNANKRTDRYGGSIPNRARLLQEVVREVSDEIGADRVGVRLSPASPYQEMADSDPQALFAHVFGLLDEAGIAYLHLVEPGISGAAAAARPADAIDSGWAREHFSGNIISAGGHDGASAEAVVAKGHADAVAFGRAYIANPDLPARIAAGAPLNEPDHATFYTEGDKGYIDYPTLQDTVDA